MSGKVNECEVHVHMFKTNCHISFVGMFHRTAGADEAQVSGAEYQDAGAATAAAETAEAEQQEWYIALTTI